MDEAISIIKYIEYLNDNHNLSISLHTRSDLKLVFTEKLSVLSIHRNPYCAFVKSQKDMHINCVTCQQKALRLTKNGDFCGLCYAGVFEYVYPIFKDDRVVAMISVSGYRTSEGENKCKHFTDKYCLSSDTTLKIYNSLNYNLPDKTFLDTLITPLCKMLELAYIKNFISVADKDLYHSIKNYITSEHTNPITIDSVCKRFNYSKSHISHLFKKNSGMGLREYINNLRIKDACYLLKNSHLSVSEIAYLVGFADVSYFIVVFKKITKKTPAQYRLGLIQTP